MDEIDIDAIGAIVQAHQEIYAIIRSAPTEFTHVIPGLPSVDKDLPDGDSEVGLIAPDLSHEGYHIVDLKVVGNNIHVTFSTNVPE